MPDRPVRFNQRSADRITDAAQRSENQFYTQPNIPPAFVPPGAFLPVVECIVTTAITAASGTTYGVGRIQPYAPTLNSSVFNSNTNSYTNTYVGNPDYTFAYFDVNSNSVVNTVECINWSRNSNTISTDTHGWACWRNGFFEWLVGDC